MKIFYILLGSIALALGAIGAVLPLLPTTPFLMVSAFSFAKSSPRLSTWFQGTRLYKNYLDSFRKGEGMTVKTKVRILLTITALLAVAAFAMSNVPYGFVIIGAVWLIHVIAFCFVIKTKKEEASK